MNETTKTTTPYFSVNRDDEHDFYEAGYKDGFAGVSASPPDGKISKASSYMSGWLAGDKKRRGFTG